MRKKIITIFTAILVLAWMGFQPACGQTNKLTFKVDMSDAGVEDPATVGIRGSIEPLSWTETYPMKGPDKNGIYSATIVFENIDYGTRLQYKYHHGENKWDNDSYGEYGNRVTAICCKKQVVPVDTWDELSDYAYEIMYESSAWDVFMSWIYSVGTAKNRGLSMQEIAQEHVDFWDWPIDKDAGLEMFMKMDQFYQAKMPSGYFEEVENSPERIEYVASKTWEVMIYQWNEDGVVKGVTAEDMTEFIKKLTSIYVEMNDARLEWIDEEDHKVRIIISK